MTARSTPVKGRWPKEAAVVEWATCPGHFAEITSTPYASERFGYEVIDLHPLNARGPFGSERGAVCVLRPMTVLAADLLGLAKEDHA
jgi:hypothetical protein